MAKKAPRMILRIGPTRSESLPCAARTGFALLELILVLLILGLGAALAAPALGHFARGRQTNDAATHLLAVIQYAQDRAAGDGTPYRLLLDPAANTYRLTARQDGEFSQIRSDFGLTFTLPEHLTAKWDASQEVTTRGYIQFDPDGGHDVAIIRLTATDGSELQVGCLSPSEPYRVFDPARNPEAR